MRLNERTPAMTKDRYLIFWTCRDGSEVIAGAPSRNKAIDLCWSGRPQGATRAVVMNDADQVEHVVIFLGLHLARAGWVDQPSTQKE